MKAVKFFSASFVLLTLFTQFVYYELYKVMKKEDNNGSVFQYCYPLLH